MGGKKKGSGPQVKPNLRFRPPPAEPGRFTPVGTKPLAEPASVSSVLSMMVVHLSRQILYGVDVSHKVGMYLVLTLVLSVVGDFSSQRSNWYMSRESNFFNVYFVKYGWGWTILFTGAFVFITSYTYSCGNINVIKNQLTRLFIASGIWYGLTGSFLIIQEKSGVCNVTRLLNKDECLRGGHKWKGFDISGHCFLLVWNSLFMIEEAKAYIGWEKIKDMIRNEEHRRLSTDINVAKNFTVLSNLSLDEFLHLRKNYNTYTPHVRIFFCLMSVLVLLWDVMLVCTALYFHILIEKVIACMAAVVLWFILYRGIYVHPWSPGLPGEGPFKYVNFKAKQEILERKESLKRRYENKWQPKDELPKFLGMPLYGLNKATESRTTTRSEEAPVGPEVSSAGVQRPLRKARSRSSSRSSTAVSKYSLNSNY